MRKSSSESSEVETSVKVTLKSPSQDYTHPDDHNLLTYDMTQTITILPYFLYITHLLTGTRLDITHLGLHFKPQSLHHTGLSSILRWRVSAGALTHLGSSTASCCALCPLTPFSVFAINCNTTWYRLSLKTMRIRLRKKFSKTTSTHYVIFIDMCMHLARLLETSPLKYFFFESALRMFSFFFSPKVSIYKLKTKGCEVFLSLSSLLFFLSSVLF